MVLGVLIGLMWEMMQIYYRGSSLSSLVALTGTPPRKLVGTRRFWQVWQVCRQLTEETVMTNKTLKTFVDSLIQDGFEPNGTTDYKTVDLAATKYFGHALPNAQVWKVLNHLGKPKIQEVVDDL